ncbi:MAG: signal peptidase I, partial [Archangium sp.]|nr:signal peptidase I [Archangium sp.]
MAAAPPSFADTVRSQLQAAELAALNRARWIDRLCSLWAPVTVLACVFLPYLAIVETAGCAYLWLQPPMQVLAGLCFLWWAALVLARLAARRWSDSLKARAHAEEVLGDVERMAAKHRTALKDKASDELVAAAAELVRVLPGSAAAVTDATKRLEAASEKHLAKLRGSSAAEWGGGFVKALAIALLVRSVFLEPFKIPSGSMIPTLEIGDQIFVNKFIYGVRIPFTNWVPFTIVRPPKAGDVIVFNNPVRPELDYIKRVIAVGGDTVELRGREVIVNGAVLETKASTPELDISEQPYHGNEGVADWLRSWFIDDWVTKRQALAFETIDGKAHYVLYEGWPRVADGTFKVPPDHVFVMGDNRDNSEDGRFGLGGSHGAVEYAFVPRGHIKGKATVIWLPLGHDGWLSSIFGGTGLRTERLFLP